jgi:hypothetical protein
MTAFSHTLGYLLAWKVILNLVEHASDELRPKYSEFLENKVSFSQKKQQKKIMKQRHFWNSFKKYMVKMPGAGATQSRPTPLHFILLT